MRRGWCWAGVSERDGFARGDRGREDRHACEVLLSHAGVLRFLRLGGLAHGSESVAFEAVVPELLVVEVFSAVEVGVEFGHGEGGGYVPA